MTIVIYWDSYILTLQSQQKLQKLCCSKLSIFNNLWAAQILDYTQTTFNNIVRSIGQGALVQPFHILLLPLCSIIPSTIRYWMILFFLNCSSLQSFKYKLLSSGNTCTNLCYSLVCVTSCHSKFCLFVPALCYVPLFFLHALLVSWIVLFFVSLPLSN